MNLDELKIQLNKKLETAQSFEMVVGGDVSSIHQTKTNAITHKIKRSLITEIIFSIVFIAAFIVVCVFTKFHSIRLYFGVFSLVLILFTVILFYLLQRTNRLNTAVLPVVQNLKSLHKILNEFVKRYFQFTMLLIPVSLLFSSYLGYTDAKNHIESFNYFPVNITAKKQLIFLSIFLIVFVVSMYYFTKWYLKKLYGNHLIQLKQMIEQLES